MALLKQQWLYDDTTFHDVPIKHHKVLVHTIRLGDVEDPDIYVAEPIWQWQQTEAGKFVMEHSLDKPSFHKMLDHLRYGYIYNIVAYFDEKTLIYWKLKYE